MSDLIPQDFIDDLVQRIDIIEVISNQIEIKKAGREYKGLCPFHTEKTPSFTVSQEKGFYHCFGCGAHGTALGFLMDYGNQTFIEAIEELSKIAGVEIPKTKQDRAKNKKNKSLQELTAEIMGQFIQNLSQSEKAIAYLKNRNIDGKTAKKFSIGFANDSWDDILKKFGTSDTRVKKLLDCGLIIKKDDSGYYDRFRNRIMFPIRDNKGNVLGFGGRIIDDGEPKYLNSPETQLFKKGQLLYGMFESKEALRSSSEAIIVEGYTDVIALSMNGFGNALATLGTATTDTHIKNVFRFANKITFCFDGDRAGKDAAWKACEICLPNLTAKKEVGFLILPDNQDPDQIIASSGPQLLKKLLDDALPLSDFLIQTIKKEFAVNTINGRAMAAEKSMSLVNKIPGGIYKDLMIEKIASELKMKVSQLKNIRTQARMGNIQRKSSPLKEKDYRRRPSLIRQAIKILIHYPDLAKNINLEKTFHFIDDKGIKVFDEILNFIQSRESIKSATISEHFQDKNIRVQLKKMIAEPLLISEQEATNELNEIVTRLYEKNQNAEFKALVNKAKENELSQTERDRFLELTKSIKIK
ncbi:MAG TPA: DNA primase [Gammaproteobacteria bacterium]|jgi:DNA primase|nr:DNA primase [Gammaproteobacteria bacterium]